MSQQTSPTVVEVTSPRSNENHEYLNVYDMAFVFKVPEPPKPEEETSDAPSSGRFSCCSRASKPEPEKVLPLTAPEVLNAIKVAGLDIHLFKSVQNDEVYCLVGASEARLEEEADRIDYDVLLDFESAISAGMEKKMRLAQSTRSTAPEDKFVTDKLWYNIYGKFDRDPQKKKLYTRYKHKGSVHADSCFREVDRVKLIMSIIECDKLLGGAGLAIGKILADPESDLLAFFAMHDHDAKQKLWNKWNSPKAIFSQPLDDIRNYFGESVGLYFAFLEFYNRALLIPAAVGVIFMILHLVYGNIYDAKGNYVFGVFVAVWATVFLEFWKRTQSRLAVRWGMTKWDFKEQPRPEFQGEWIRSPVHGKLEAYFPWYQKLKRALLSQSIVVVGISTLGILAIRTLFESSAGGKNIATYASIANAVQIQVFNMIYGQVSHRLNEFENHRTDTEYENALIAKNFLFKFINSYLSLFYLAFFRRFFGDCGEGDIHCLDQLRSHLGIVFVSMIFMNNTIEILTPIIMGQVKAYQESQAETGIGMKEMATNFKKDLKRASTAGSIKDSVKVFQSQGLQRSPPEIEYEMAPYEGTFDDFDELVIQFGFVVLFVVAFPLTPLLALLNNFLEQRLDATKIMKFVRRPEPKGADDIGTWYDVLSVIAYLSVVTNVILSIFFSNEIANAVDPEASELSKVRNMEMMVFVAFVAEHAIIFLKLLISYWIPDIPSDVVSHISRQDYIVSVLVEDVPEDDTDEVKKTEADNVFAPGKNKQNVVLKDDWFDMMTVPGWEPLDFMVIKEEEEE